eukprot:5106169-Amphidinium_carterae.1
MGTVMIVAQAFLVLSCVDAHSLSLLPQIELRASLVFPLASRTHTEITHILHDKLARQRYKRCSPVLSQLITPWSLDETHALWPLGDFYP